MYQHEKLKIYDEKEGMLQVGIKGKYLCKPRWYKLRYTKGSQEEFILWKGRRAYTGEMELAPEFLAREVKTV